MDVLDEPFSGSWAVGSGLLTRWELQQGFQRLHRDVYIRRGTPIDERNRALAAAHWAKGRGVLTGCSAAALLGAPCPGNKPTELFHPTVTRAPKSILLRRDRFRSHEVMRTHGVTVTTPARTAFDLGRRLPFSEAVETIDALCNSTGITVNAIAAIAKSHAGARGITALRSALRHADPAAASRQETQLRLLLTTAGLPQPKAQFILPGTDTNTRVVLGWPAWKVAVEPVSKLDETVVAEELGWKTVWVTPELVARRPELLLARVRAALQAQGARL